MSRGVSSDKINTHLTTVGAGPWNERDFLEHSDTMQQQQRQCVGFDRVQTHHSPMSDLEPDLESDHVVYK